MSDPTPHLTRLIKLEKEGFKEIPGPDSNQVILDWGHGPAHYPDITDDSTTPWCGIGMAGVFNDVGMGASIPKDSAAAISWLNCGPPCEPKVGAIAVFSRPGGNHVTCIREIKGGEWLCTGCNQSDAITTARFLASQCKGTRWPKSLAQPTKVTTMSSKYTELLQRSQVDPSWQGAIDKAANVIVKNRKIYKEIEEATGVPWAFIGALHYRESTNNFKTHLHNGDPLSHRTVSEPPGRPTDGEPPFTWTESAIDAMEYDNLDGLDNWTLENICERGERYNGPGYSNKGVPSPYLWSGTNIYVRGKYDADGHYDAGLVDKQAGIIPLYLRTMDLAHESTIREGSRKIRVLDNVRLGVQSLFTTIGGLFTLDNLGVFKEIFGFTSSVIDAKLLITLCVGGAIVWVLVNWLDKLMVQDAKAGAYVPSKAEPIVQNTTNEPILEDETIGAPDATAIDITTSVSV